jgi:hypothetical protein
MKFKYLATWDDHNTRPIFNVHSYQYSYDGKTHAFEAWPIGIWEFLDFVASIIEDTGFDGIQGVNQSTEDFLDSAGVTPAFWTKGK